MGVRVPGPYDTPLCAPLFQPKVIINWWEILSLKKSNLSNLLDPDWLDPIVQPIVIMPLSRTYNTTFTMPLIEDMS
ncbi:hypothetical protein TNCV_1455361 [Trichonephila clavipes]|nr:hypothetical protein TNCV_1455361 [Trichonephila clavipes]